MTDVITDVLVRIRFADGETHEWSFADLVADVPEGYDPATIADDDVMALVRRQFDTRDDDDFAWLVVSRPETGNILIMSKPTYGASLDERERCDTVTGVKING